MPWSKLVRRLAGRSIPNGYGSDEITCYYAHWRRASGSVGVEWTLESGRSAEQRLVPEEVWRCARHDSHRPKARPLPAHISQATAAQYRLALLMLGIGRHSLAIRS
jgi:hypothetical protein